MLFTKQYFIQQYNENSTDDEEFVCVNDENDVIILDYIILYFSVVVVENITWI